MGGMRGQVYTAELIDGALSHRRALGSSLVLELLVMSEMIMTWRYEQT